MPPAPLRPGQAASCRAARRDRPAFGTAGAFRTRWRRFP